MKVAFAQEPIQILIAEDSPTQAQAVRELLEARGYLVTVAGNGKLALEQARKTRPTLAISDIVMPEMDGFQFCKALRSDPRLKDIPVILVTSLATPEDVIRGLDAGADNFIRKPFDERYLISRIEYILSNRQLRASSKMGVEMEIVLGGKKHRISSERQQILDLLISTYEDAVSLNSELMEKQDELSQLTEQLEKRVQERTKALKTEVEVRKQAEERLRQLASIVESTEDAVISTDVNGVVRIWNEAAVQLFGYSAREAQGRNISFITTSEDHDAFLQYIARAQLGDSQRFEGWIASKDDKRIAVSVTASPVRNDNGVVSGVSAIIRDLTERRLLEEQLRQSQKLEALGALAGGIAHDFNNLLNVILGYGELALERLKDDNPVCRQITQMRGAAEKAASLARQLLAFSRRQVLEPRVLDLNSVVSGLEKILRRVIGENIELKTDLATDLGYVKADPTQVEQIIMNLVVNARDAMPMGGRLSISTSNCQLDEEYVRKHSSTRSGSYVMIAVTDSGSGIPPEVQSRIFEPFFTTKEPGKGTGLGLSTVYGIVTQSGGHIWVYSEMGKGTTFKIYLPQVQEKISANSQPQEEVDLSGTETVLLVEDAPNLRELAREFLANNGYTVLEASNGAEALELAGQHQGEIDLLLTDVIMPGMSGAELARKVMETRPSMQVIYASGYTADAISHHGVLDEGVVLIEKPYTRDKLLRKVHEVLRPSH